MNNLTKVDILVYTRKRWWGNFENIHWWYCIVLRIKQSLFMILLKRLDTVKNRVNMFEIPLTYLFTNVLEIYSMKSVLILLTWGSAFSAEFYLYPFNLQPIWPWTLWSMIDYFLYPDMVFGRKNIIFIKKGEDRHQGEIMFLREINNHVFIIAPSFWV